MVMFCTVAVCVSPQEELPTAHIQKKCVRFCNWRRFLCLVKKKWMRASSSSAILIRPGSNYWDGHPDPDVFEDFHLFPWSVVTLSLNTNTVVDTGSVSEMVIHRMGRKGRGRLPYPWFCRIWFWLRVKGLPLLHMVLVLLKKIAKLCICTLLQSL